MSALGAISSLTIQQVEPIYLQANLLTVVDQSAGISQRVITDPGFAGDAGTILDATAVENYVTYLVPYIPASSYDVHVGVKDASTRGLWQLAIGRADNFARTKSNVGAPQDQYTPGTVYADVDLGIWKPSTTGDK